MALKQVIASMLAAALGAAVWAEEDYVPSAALNDVGLAEYWQLRLPLEAKQHLTDAYLVDDQLYLGTQDGYVFAVHTHTGAIRWLRQVTRSGHRLRPPVHAGERVIFITPTNVLQLDRLFGDGIALTDLRFPTGSPAVTDGARFYIGGIDARMYAFSIEDQFEQWKAGTSAPIRARPALYGETLFLACDDGVVYACTAARRRFQWQTLTSGSIVADLVVNEAGVYVASQDHSLYLLDHQFGQARWRARFSGPLHDAPVVTPELAYQYCVDDGLVAVETAGLDVEKRFRWKLPRGRVALTVHNGLAYVLSRDETILAVRIDSGEVKRSIPAPGLTLAMPAPDSAAIFLAAPDGRVFCARPRGVPPVQADDIRRALLPREQRGAGGPATTQPARPVEKRIPDYLETRSVGRPIGGQSKITREFLEKQKSGGGS